MESYDGRLQPIALALFSRDREEDYRWVFEEGSGELLNAIKAIHRDLIADQDARPAATFALLDNGVRLALLVANLKTTRYDHLRTRFDDTLVLEFDDGERPRLLGLAADLLAAHSGNARQALLDYAEARYLEKQQTDRTRPDSLAIPSLVRIQKSDQRPADKRMGDHVALRSNKANLRRVALVLEGMASNPSSAPHPFLLVSTGFVGKAKLQQHAEGYAQFIALTRSSTFPDEEDVLLQVVVGDKQPEASHGPWRLTLLMFTSRLLAILLLGAWLLLG